MKKKYKILLTIIVLIILLPIIFFFMTRPKNYTKEYERKEYKIKETYSKELQVYQFTIEKDDLKFETVSLNKYLNKKELIDSVEYFENEDKKEYCVLPKSAKLDFTPLCMKDSALVDISLLESETDEFYTRPSVDTEKGTYKNIESNSTRNLKFLVWAQKGYYSLDKDKFTKPEKKDLSPMFLEKESYYNKLAYQVDEFIITPNYDQEYSFDTLFVFNFKKGSLATWKLEEEISYNSYYLGDIDGLVYLFDRKNEKEYSIDPKRRKIEIVTKDGNGQVYLDEWKEISTTKLAATDYHFEKKQAFIYYRSENGLSLKYYGSKESVLISKKKIDKILSIKGDRVYYLVKDKLYEYTPQYGEIHLLTYSEWAFNNMNSVFIY